MSGAPAQDATGPELPGVGRGIPNDAFERLDRAGVRVVDILDEVEKRLARHVSSPYPFIDRAARYLLDAGGKRFRPMLVAITAHYGDPTRDEVPDGGVVVELVHLATLYHDDVIDEATARRGAESANLRWDNTVAVATGDFLFARASELSADLGVETTRIMGRTIARLAEGEIREVQGSRSALPPDVPRLEPDLEHYLAVISEKTASLIETSCRLGALLSGCDPDTVEAASAYGWNVGMAFQLSDDILDIASDHEDSGKTPGTDLREGVRTLPILYALEDAPSGELADLLTGEQPLDDDGVARALELLQASDALDRARETAATYVDEAVAALAPLESGPTTTALTRIAEFALDRVG
ncbi:MAG: polyprenyl synthetase family protein [Nitriliruptorales bacterium]|nr:polyprenyl synthetase family protein [Nitriliruptorales bacterium]